MRKATIFILVSLIAVLGATLGIARWYWRALQAESLSYFPDTAAVSVPRAPQFSSFNSATSLPSPTPRPSLTPSPSAAATAVPSQSMSVPFIVQAPFGRWENPLFQDGCEEASLLMAWHWLQGTALTEAGAAEAIVALSQFQDATYGAAPDRSAADTARLFQDYFKHQDVQVSYNVTAADIRAALARGSVVVVPVDGRAIGNPHYTPPGPERHMLVIHGYDAVAGQFITNDPGTRFGNNYRYGEAQLLRALRDYPTGNHLPIPGRRAAMIEVLPT